MTRHDLMPLVNARKDAWRDVQHYESLCWMGCDAEQELAESRARYELIATCVEDAKQISRRIDQCSL